MAELAGRRFRRKPTPWGTGRSQSGQVLLDALIATALIAGAMLTVGRAANALLDRAQQRHREVLSAIEAENTVVMRHEAPAAD